MKLHPAILTFGEVEGKPTIGYNIPDTNYGVTFRVTSDGKGVVSTVTPAQYRDPDSFDGDMPEELEMLVAQGHLQFSYIAAHLAKPSDATRIALSLAHEGVEKGKLLTPFLVEEIIVGTIYALATEITPQQAFAMGLGAEEVTGTPNELERNIIAATQTNNEEEMLRYRQLRRDTTLARQVVFPALTDAERASQPIDPSLFQL